METKMITIAVRIMFLSVLRRAGPTGDVRTLDAATDTYGTLEVQRNVIMEIVIQIRNRMPAGRPARALPAAIACKMRVKVAMTATAIPMMPVRMAQAESVSQHAAATDSSGTRTAAQKPATKECRMAEPITATSSVQDPLRQCAAMPSPKQAKTAMMTTKTIMIAAPMALVELANLHCAAMHSFGIRMVARRRATMDHRMEQCFNVIRVAVTSQKQFAATAFLNREKSATMQIRTITMPAPMCSGVEVAKQQRAEMRISGMKVAEQNSAMMEPIMESLLNAILSAVIRRSQSAATEFRSVVKSVTMQIRRIWMDVPLPAGTNISARLPISRQPSSSTLIHGPASRSRRAKPACQPAAMARLMRAKSATTATLRMKMDATRSANLNTAATPLFRLSPKTAMPATPVQAAQPARHPVPPVPTAPPARCGASQATSAATAALLHSAAMRILNAARNAMRESTANAITPHPFRATCKTTIRTVTTPHVSIPPPDVQQPPASATTAPALCVKMTSIAKSRTHATRSRTMRAAIPHARISATTPPAA